MGSRCLSKIAKLSSLYGTSSKSGTGVVDRECFWGDSILFGLRRYFGKRVGSDDGELSRDFLAELWVVDWKMERSRGKRRTRKTVKSENLGDSFYGGGGSLERWFSGSAVGEEKPYNGQVGKPFLQQPPVSEPVSGFLEPASQEEVQVAPLLARSNLLITRDIEWANLVLGFEQENRYAIVDVCYPQSPVGLIREQSNVIARQIPLWESSALYHNPQHDASVHHPYWFMGNISEISAVKLPTQGQQKATWSLQENQITRSHESLLFSNIASLLLQSCLKPLNN
ncbi:hypothetical protein JRO89_XS04G0056700 [Xanthoceras sorbifolium]|uniref:Phospholipid scramblase n=1 Tax=Xanthoceras sorbifolium TaxID=99658 RepID=A0ABQ8I498_9ROSI|nr:hypothetical protein JRO89_XS04G0056700 [Xanthoceras sorbifolium]